MCSLLLGYDYFYDKDDYEIDDADKHIRKERLHRPSHIYLALIYYLRHAYYLGEGRILERYYKLVPDRGDAYSDCLRKNYLHHGVGAREPKALRRLHLTDVYRLYSPAENLGEICGGVKAQRNYPLLERRKPKALHTEHAHELRYSEMDYKKLDYKRSSPYYPDIKF